LPLTWHGVTLYGALDVGAGWVSHGMPENGCKYEGESLINRNANASRFVITQYNLQQTGLGLKAKEEFLPSWSSRCDHSCTGDGARAGQIFNDELRGGISSKDFGTLTFGR
jgi:hypothetical protein